MKEKHWKCVNDDWVLEEVEIFFTSDKDRNKFVIDVLTFIKSNFKSEENYSGTQIIEIIDKVMRKI